jgi:endonuclease/exonuclease/phosphatase family metal-dependent hydrolase
VLGNSFPSRRPIAPLDRIVHSPEWRCSHAGVHHSALATLASDHLPVRATLELPAR